MFCKEGVHVLGCVHPAEQQLCKDASVPSLLPRFESLGNLSRPMDAVRHTLLLHQSIGCFFFDVAEETDNESDAVWSAQVQKFYDHSGIETETGRRCRWRIFTPFPYPR